MEGLQIDFRRLQESGQRITLSQLALLIASTQVGVSEQPKGSNDGPEVASYLRSIGLGPSYAWCMAFVYWNFALAALLKGTRNPVAKVGGVMECYRKAQEAKYKVIVNNGKLLPKDILPGDVFFMRFDKGTGHVGIVEGVELKGGVTCIHTIEGNTNDDGSREGIEVARRSRLLSDLKIVGLVRFA